MSKTKQEIEQIAEQVADAIPEVHRLRTCLKHSGHRPGFIVNGNVPVIKDGTGSPMDDDRIHRLTSRS